MESFFILVEERLIKLTKEIVENEDSFIERLLFFIQALNLFNIEKAETLSFSYMNKMLYNCIYSNKIEQDIEDVLKIYKKNVL